MKSLITCMLAAVALLSVNSSLAEERGDMSIQAFGTLSDDNATVSGSFGMMVLERVKGNVGLAYSCYNSCDISTQVLFLEGQYYFGDYYTAESFLFSAGGGFLVSNFESEFDDGTEVGYHVFGQANQFFDELENASVFYRLEYQKIGDLDSTTALRFGLEVSF